MSGLVALRPPPDSPAPSGREVTFHVESGDFAFTPGRIDVAQGDRVTLVLRSTDVVHGLHLEGYAVELVSDPGRPESATFVADRPGIFRYRCSIPCGPLHPFMTGRLRVGPSPLPLALLAVVTAAVTGGLVAWRRRPPPIHPP
jgi:heme/copper-type cytochrome/quinol oxidase subunit 2